MNKVYKMLGIGLMSLPIAYGCSSTKISSEVQTILTEQKKAEQRLEQEVKNDVNRSIKSVPDHLMDFNGALAEKAKKTSQYVVSDSKSKYLVGEYGNMILNSEIESGGRKYTVLIYDFNEQKTGLMDYLQIKKTARNKKLRKETQLRDTGFDGRCDKGNTFLDSSEDEEIFDAFLGEVEHRDAYQKKYEKALDDVIGFYESKRK